MFLKKITIAAVGALFWGSSLCAQETAKLTNAKGSEYEFQVLRSLEREEVENQGRSGTCWSFSTLSFFEAEAERVSKKKVQLSPMFVVHHAYRDKAEKYVRMHGSLNFGAGGAFHDVAYVLDEYGAVPRDAYTGLDPKAKMHDHGEMDKVLKAVVDVIIERKSPSNNWQQAIEAVLNSYLGETPETFVYEGKTYTPKQFGKEMGLDMSEYVSITSYTHHPFYTMFDIEVPDNWMHRQSYNVPLDEMMEIFDNAVMNGYSVAWGSDVSEKGFNYRAGLAILPEDDSQLEVKGEDSEYFNDAGAFKYGEAFRVPVKEKMVTQEMRQEAFDNFETTDDHGMQVIGAALDQTGKKFYIVKNSWGKTNECDGYFYASEPFVRYKTMNFLVHKDAVPKNIRKKLNL